jgi:hypothetical protein
MVNVQVGNCMCNATSRSSSYRLFCRGCSIYALPFHLSYELIWRAWSQSDETPD